MMPVEYWLWNVAFLVWGLYVAWMVYKIKKKLEKLTERLEGEGNG